MARVQLLLCFAFLFASVTFMEVVSAHLNIKPSLPQIEDPKTVNDVEPYTVKVVMVFVSDLEKECPKTNKFKDFFDRLRAYAKYVCPIAKKDEKDYDRDMKAKAGSLLQAISSFAVGKIKEEIREEKEEAIQTFKWMKSVGAKILGGRKKEESEEPMKLTAEQQKEIKEGILKWETLITRITNTMVQTTTTITSEGEGSTTGKGSPSGTDSGSGSGSKSSGSGSSSFSSGTSFEDTTGSGSSSGSPSGSPASSPSGSTYAAAGGSASGSSFDDTTGESPMSPTAGSTSSGLSESASGSSFEDTTGESPMSPTAGPTSSASSESASGSSFEDTTGESPMSPTAGPTSSASSESASGSSFKDTTGESPMSPTAGPTSSASSESASGSQSSATTVSELEAETSEEVMSFIMNLEKKCPPKEEYKSFFEKLKGTMTASAKVTAQTKKGFFAGVKSAAGKISDAMSFMGARIGSKSSEVKKSMENYHAEVMKALQELETIHSKIISQNQGKKDGSVTVTAEQRTEIKQTITKWEQVTTQYVETSMKSEASSNSTVGIDKVKLT